MLHFVSSDIVGDICDCCRTVVAKSVQCDYCKKSVTQDVALPPRPSYACPYCNHLLGVPPGWSKAKIVIGITIIVKGNELKERFIDKLEYADLNPYMFKDGLADDSTEFRLSYEQCMSLGMVKQEFEARSMK